jgi:SAM-dependent methyltransferase
MKRLLRRCADWIDLQWSVLEHSLRAVAPQARGRLLDVGCGDKPYEAWFRPFVSAYVGVEHGDTFASTAAGVRGRPDVVYNGGTLPFRDGSFDTVLSVQVLEHTPHPAALMAEMSRVLAPDGLLILTAPFQFRLHEQPHDYFRYSPHGLRQLCADVGLEVFETVPQGSLWTVIGHKLNSTLSLRVARVGQLAQVMGKLGHEAPQGQGVRWWTLPVVGPMVVGIAAGARLMDRWLPDPEESLGFLVLARPKGFSRGAERAGSSASPVAAALPAR